MFVHGIFESGRAPSQKCNARRHEGPAEPMPGNWRSRLAAEIRKAKRHGLSPSKIAVQAGFGVNYINSILKEEESEITPRLDRIERICDILGVSLAYILTGLELSPEDERLIEKIARLDDDHRNLVLAMIDAFDKANRKDTTSDETPPESAAAQDQDPKSDDDPAP